MKKILSLVVMIGILSSLFSFTAFSQDELPIYEDLDGVRYQYSIENGEVTINSILFKIRSGYDIYIPEEIEGYPVTVIGDGAIVAGSIKLNSVVVPKHVKKIEEGAFLDCPNLFKVVLPEGLEIIEDDAFYGCKSLKKINIPDTVTKIGYSAFQECTSLTSINIPDDIDTLGTSAFKDCTNLKDVTWNKCVKNPGSWIFSNTKYLTETENNLLLFNNGTLLNEYCGSEDFIFPESVTDISATPLCNSTARKVTIPSRFSYVEDGICFGMKNLEEVVFEGDIEYIGSGAFCECKALKEFTVPAGTKSISPNAFNNCLSLEKINLPDSLLFIGRSAFYKCESLKDIKLPDTLLTIENQAFYGCSALEKIVIPPSVEKLGEQAFRECKNLKSVTLPARVANVYAYYMSPNIENVTVTNGTADPYLLYEIFKNTKWAEKTGKPKSETGFNVNGNVLLEYDGDSRNPVIPDGIEIIGNNAFAGKDIDTVTIPSSVKTIRAAAFMGSKIKEITIPSNVQTVEPQAFAWCKDLKKITVEKGAGRLGNSAFFECTSLIPEEVKIADGVRYSKETFFNTPLDEDWLSANATPEPEETPMPTESPLPTSKPIMLVRSADGEVTVSVNDKMVNFPDAKPFIDENDRTQIPVRAVAETLGCSVDYNEEDKIVTVKDKENIITLTIGSSIIKKNGLAHQMDTKAIISEDRTYIPARFVAEVLGYEVKFSN
jgi:hypothetical protein